MSRKVGDRVRVAIPERKREQWAHGAADALDGSIGSVEQIRADPDRCCVAFDKPARTWWEHQSPQRGGWFESDEIEAITLIESIEFIRATEDRYWELLGALPPIARLPKGFLLGEEWSHRVCSEARVYQPTYKAVVAHDGLFYESTAGLTGPEWRASDPARITVLSLYQELRAAEIPTTNHESDLYVLDTPQARHVIAKHGKSGSAFTSQIDGKAWLDVPFAYDPFWQRKV